nr:hypothetical protein [Paraburkholderia bannensis]
MLYAVIPSAALKPEDWPLIQETTPFAHDNCGAATPAPNTKSAAAALETTLDFLRLTAFSPAATQVREDAFQTERKTLFN